MSSVFNVFGWHSTPDLVWRYIFSNYASRTNDAALADGYIVAYYCVTANKCILLNMDFPSSICSSFLLWVYVVS